MEISDNLDVFDIEFCCDISLLCNGFLFDGMPHSEFILFLNAHKGAKATVTSGKKALVCNFVNRIVKYILSPTMILPWKKAFLKSCGISYETYNKHAGDPINSKENTEFLEKLEEIQQKYDERRNPKKSESES